MELIIRLLSGRSKIIRHVTLRWGWFGTAYITVQGRNYKVRPGDTFNIDIPIEMSLIDFQSEKES